MPNPNDIAGAVIGDVFGPQHPGQQRQGNDPDALAADVINEAFGMQPHGAGFEGGRPVYQRPAPSLADQRLIEETTAGYATGKIPIDTILRNTKEQLVKKYGQENVREYRTSAGVQDFEIKRTVENGDTVWVSSGVRDYLRDMQQAKQQEMLKNADQSRGSDFGTRAAASMPVSERGRMNLLVKRYGSENVQPFMDRQGKVTNWYVRESPESKWHPIDKNWSPELADVADMAGPAVETLPGIIGGVLGSYGFSRAGQSPAAGAQTGTVLGDLAGSAARQAIAEGLGANEQLGATGRIAAAGENVAAGIAGEGIARAAKAGLSVVNPVKYLRESLAKEGVQTGGRAVEKTTAKDVATGARELERATGVPMTPAQLGGGQSQTLFEEMVRTSPAGSSQMKAFDVAQAQKLRDFVFKTIDATGGGRFGAAEAGDRVAGSYNAYMKKFSVDALKPASAAFDASDAASKGTKIVSLAETADTLKRIAEEYRQTLKTGSAETAFGDLNRKLQAVVDANGNPVSVSARDLQNMLSDWGKAAKGSGSAIKDLDKARDRRIAAKVFDALQQDFERAALNGEGSGLAELKVARQAWREGMERIEAERDAVLEKALELSGAKKPHQIAQAITSDQFSDQQVRSAMVKLGKIDADVAQQVRGVAMRRMLQKAEAAANSGVGSASETLADVPLSQAKFYTMATKNRARIAAILADDPAALADWNKAVAVAGKIADKGGLGRSPTAPLLWAGNTLAAIAQGARNPQQLLMEAAKFTSARRLADVFTDPAKRDLYMGLVNPPPNWSPQQISRTFTKLLDLTYRDERMGEAIQPTEGAPTERGPAYSRTSAGESL